MLTARSGSFVTLLLDLGWRSAIGASTIYLFEMEKHDSDSGGQSPTGDIEKLGHDATRKENALDKFPDPDAGKSDEERAAIVGGRCKVCIQTMAID